MRNFWLFLNLHSFAYLCANRSLPVDVDKPWGGLDWTMIQILLSFYRHTLTIKGYNAL